MKEITQEELDKILELHRMWLNGEGSGKRANLRDADLRYADLEGADLEDAILEGADLKDANLRYANLRGVNLEGADLSYANLTNANLSYADLSYADLEGADLSYANLKDADLDYSCLPLWCGSLEANFNDKQLTQIAYHLVKSGLRSNNASKRVKGELSKLIDLANEFHKVEECGRIGEEERKK